MNLKNNKWEAYLRLICVVAMLMMGLTACNEQRPPGKPAPPPKPVDKVEKTPTPAPTVVATVEPAPAEDEPSPSAVKTLAPAGDEPSTGVVQTPAPPANLIANGSFDEWKPDAATPEGFQAPETKEYKRLMYVARRNLGEGGHMVFQIWKTHDHRIPFDKKFGAVVDGLKPDSVYQLVVTVTSLDQTTASISVYEYPTEGEPTILKHQLIRVESGVKNAKYAKKFKTKQEGRIKILAHANKETTFPGRIAWLRWELREVKN